MQSTISLYNVEDECISGHSADEKPFESNFVNCKKVAEESGSFSHGLLPEQRATSSHLSRFRRIDDVANSHTFESSAASVSSECSSVTTSASNPEKATKCHVCLKPPTTAFSQPLIKCACCRRRYHTECHNPPAPLGDNM